MSSVLADAGRSLVHVLRNAVQQDDVLRDDFASEDQISLKSPKDLEDDGAVKLSVYLYRVVEDPHGKNQFPVEGNGGKLRKPPLALDLFYLMTPLFRDPESQQTVLGKVMEVLYDHPTLEEDDLVGGLIGSAAKLRVLLNPVSLEEMTRIWQALEMSYRLSVCYTVRVALLDSTIEAGRQPVVRRTADYGHPGRTNATPRG